MSRVNCTSLLCFHVAHVLHELSQPLVDRVLNRLLFQEDVNVVAVRYLLLPELADSRLLLSFVTRHSLDLVLHCLQTRR